MLKKSVKSIVYILTILLMFAIFPASVTMAADNTYVKTFLLPIESEKTDNVQPKPERSVNSTSLFGGGEPAFTDYLLTTNKLAIDSNIWDMAVFYDPQSNYFTDPFNGSGLIENHTVNIAIKTLDGTVVMENKNYDSMSADSTGYDWTSGMEYFKFKVYKTAELSSGDYLADVTLNTIYCDYNTYETSIVSLDFTDMPVNFDYYQIINELWFRTSLTANSKSLTVDVLYTSSLPFDKDKVGLRLIDGGGNVYAETVSSKYANYRAISNDFQLKNVAGYTLDVTGNITTGKTYFIEVSIESDLIMLAAKTATISSQEAAILDGKILNYANGIIRFETEGWYSENLTLSIDGKTTQATADSGGVVTFELNSPLDPSKDYSCTLRKPTGTGSYCSFYFQGIQTGIEVYPGVIKKGISTLTDVEVSFHIYDKDFSAANIDRIVLKDGGEVTAEASSIVDLPLVVINMPQIKVDFEFLPDKVVGDDLSIEVIFKDGSVVSKDVTTGTEQQIIEYYKGSMNVVNAIGDDFYGRMIPREGEIKIVMSHAATEDFTFEISKSYTVVQTINRVNAKSYTVTPAHGFLYTVEITFDVDLERGQHFLSVNSREDGIYFNSWQYPAINAYITMARDKKLYTLGLGRRINMPDENLFAVKAIDIATGEQTILNVENFGGEEDVYDLSHLSESAYKFIFEYDGQAVSRGASLETEFNGYFYVNKEFIYFSVPNNNLYIENTVKNDGTGALIHNIIGNGLNSIQNPVGKVFSLSDGGRYYEDAVIEFALPPATSSASWDISHAFFESKLANGQYMVVVMSGDNICAQVDVVINKAPFAIVGDLIISGNNVELKFNYDIAPVSVTTDNVYIKLGENKVSNSLTVSGNILTIGMTVAPGTNEYALMVEDTLKSASGEALGEEQEFKFTLTGANPVSPSQPNGSLGGIRGNNNSNASGTSSIVPPGYETFSDLYGYTWAREAIYTLYNKGVIKGVSDNEFAPAADITRADYLLLIVRLLNLRADFKGNFADVNQAKYYYEEIGIAKAWGLTDGVGENNFEPEASITRQDMSVLAYRILEKFDITLEPSSDSDIIVFSDYNQISDYAKEAISALVKNGLLKGSDNKLRPLDTATRAETAVFLDRLDSIISR